MVNLGAYSIQKARMARCKCGTGLKPCSGLPGLKSSSTHQVWGHAASWTPERNVTRPGNGSASSHTDNDPLNRTDPLGLRPDEWDGDFGPNTCFLASNEVSQECVPLGLENGELAHLEGDLRAQRRVAIYLPGTCQGAANPVPCDFRTAARQLKSEVNRIGGDVAVMSWLGYIPPSDKTSAFTWPDLRIVEDLKHLTGFLTSKGKVVTVIGHSWSGWLLGQALWYGMRPHNAVFAGSWLGSVPPVDLGSTRVWWACNAGDPVPCEGIRPQRATVVPADRPGTHLYFDSGTSSLCNFARIADERYADVGQPCS